MTGQKRFHEQIAAHSYSSEVQRTSRRVVTNPTADPLLAGYTFTQRQERLRQERMQRERAKLRTYVHMTPRTLAQTGVRATSGRIKAVRRLPQSHSVQGAPIPTRSGRRAKGRGLLWRILALFAMLVILALGTGFALTSNAFRIEQVNVIGTHNSRLIDSIEQMGMQGQNIFLLNVQAITGRIEENPLVASVSLSRALPNQLTVDVVERTPVLLWQTPQGTYSVDAHGVVIAPATAGADSLPTVLDMRSLSKGQRTEPGTHLNAGDIVFAQSIFERMPTVTGIKNFSVRYQLDSQGNGTYTIVGPGGWLAYLGTRQDTNSLDNRLLELQAILTLAQQQQLTLATIDVRYGLHPVYTLK
jgi:hypothetical protein